MQTHDHSAHGTPHATPVRTSRRSRWVFGGFALLAVLLLAFEHRMHLSGLIGWLPYLILLACPLMHLFMHGGHGHGGGDGRSNDGTGK
ncbi:MAG: DUF2933 domain-containing protein [Sulfuritalea sp.]|jgi:hypothetical protein|nr:DUF2933 domain-containing protein [Sulfuritalea sp.]QDX80955.1 hypothetical protein B9N43_06655 [Denitratisoma sp. DHT3]